MHFLCAILWNKRGYAPCPNLPFTRLPPGQDISICDEDPNSIFLHGQIIQFRILSVFLRGKIQKQQRFSPWTHLLIIIQLMPFDLPRPFWPGNCPRPPAVSWSCWRETFLDYVKLLPIVNRETLTEVMKLKLLLLGENGQASFDTRRMNESSSLDDGLNNLTTSETLKAISSRRMITHCTNRMKISSIDRNWKTSCGNTPLNP